jgi:threonine dehydrogenase-like Zn-dependent dehydrogenase
MLGEKDIAAAGRTARSLWYESAGLVRLHEENLPPPGTGEALVRMQFSAVSRGTERLVCEGRVPPEEYDRMRAPLQEGSFPFPVKYGYCAVGQVEEGPAFLKGESVFALHPHQSRFIAPVSMLRRLPGSLPPRRAALAANMETALNAVWDSGAGPGDRIAVVGCGLVGLLVTYICAQLPAADVTAVDLDPARTSIAQSFGARFSPPGALPDDMDIVFHASATAAGLTEAIGAAGFEGKVIELSWFGQGSVATPLGGAFHSRRLQLISSQVGSVSAGRRPRWDYSRRLGKAIELLDDDRLDALITDEIAFSETPEKLPAFLTSGNGLAAVIRYD